MIVIAVNFLFSESRIQDTTTHCLTLQQWMNQVTLLATTTLPHHRLITTTLIQVSNILLVWVQAPAPVKVLAPVLVKVLAPVLAKVLAPVLVKVLARLLPSMLQVRQNYKKFTLISHSCIPFMV